MNIHAYYKLYSLYKVELLDLTVCIPVNEEKFQSHSVTLTLVRQCRISNLSELLSYTTIYSNFTFVDQLLFELLCENTHTYTDLRVLNSCVLQKTIINREKSY